ncbi:MAG: hypothetical protein ACLSA6_13590 [Holdemania massiliensis]
MTIQTTLPRINELGCYEMRLESIGAWALCAANCWASWVLFSWA